MSRKPAVEAAPTPKDYPEEVAQYLDALQERRRTRAAEMIISLGSPNEAMEASGLSQALVSQFSRKKKTIGEALARHLEHRCGKPFGWLDQGAPIAIDRKLPAQPKPFFTLMQRDVDMMDDATRKSALTMAAGIQELVKDTRKAARKAS